MTLTKLVAIPRFWSSEQGYLSFRASERLFVGITTLLWAQTGGHRYCVPSGLGHPIGPFELMDATTSTLCLQAQEIMQEAYGERFRPRPLLKQRVRAGLVGGPKSEGGRA
jgi:hypothetical protein